LRKFKPALYFGLITAAVLSTSAGTPTSAVEARAKIEAPPPLRISPSQYHQSIADIFGTSIDVTGRFEPEVRDQGLHALGAVKVSVTDTGLERYDEIARNVAIQVMSPRHRRALFPCTPASESAPDDQCARTFISAIGRVTFRRALTDSEIDRRVKAANEATRTLGNFYAGMQPIVADLLVSPNFLFRFRNIETAPGGGTRLTGYAKASALSAFLWNSVPDDDLLTAAERGDLHDQRGLERQVERMLASPKLERGLRAFFADMLAFSEFETLSKDPTFFPRFTVKVRDQAAEQTLRTIVDHVMTRQGDYRDLFVTPHTFMTRSLAALYDVPLIETTDNGQPERWIPYTYEEGDPRAGLISQISFVALHSPSGRTSPTGRGKALRENLMCQMVPPPPGNVDFSAVEEAAHDLKTGRERLLAHSTQPMCAGCHKITDPIGLALENFDSAGGYRTTENGAPIDTSGELSGVKFKTPVELMNVLRNDPAITSCVARRAFSFATGRVPVKGDPEWAGIEKGFAETKYNVVQLLRGIALSDALTAVSPSAPEAR